MSDGNIRVDNIEMGPILKYAVKPLGGNKLIVRLEVVADYEAVAEFTRYFADMMKSKEPGTTDVVQHDSKAAEGLFPPKVDR